MNKIAHNQIHTPNPIKMNKKKHALKNITCNEPVNLKAHHEGTAGLSFTLSESPTYQGVKIRVNYPDTEGKNSPAVQAPIPLSL